jgi:hypothetical protein
MKNKTHFLLWSTFSIVFMIFLMGGCASPGNPREPSPSSPPAEVHHPPDFTENQLKFSSIQIEYELGHDHYSFEVVSKDSIQVKSYLDKHLLKVGNISREKYLPFLTKSIRLLKAYESSTRKEPNCRGPFKITIKLGESSKTSMGCRNEGEGTFGRLIRDGEFLLYSEN